MSIFDLFGLKSKLQKVFSKENIEEVINTAKEAIISKVPSEEEGAQKKAYVDSVVKNLLLTKASAFSGVTRWLVADLLTAVVPTITQLIYDHLKAYIDKLTVKN